MGQGPAGRPPAEPQAWEVPSEQSSRHSPALVPGALPQQGCKGKG